MSFSADSLSARSLDAAFRSAAQRAIAGSTSFVFRHRADKPRRSRFPHPLQHVGIEIIPDRLRGAINAPR